MITIYEPGPMHPDLFDGETPIMVPRKLRAYRVPVKYHIPVVEFESDTVVVFANDAEEAERIAIEVVKERADVDAEEFEAEDADELDNHEITERDIAEHIKRTCAEGPLRVPEFIRDRRSAA